MFPAIFETLGSSVVEDSSCRIHSIMGRFSRHLRQNFQATYKRPAGIDELRQCNQRKDEPMRSYVARFTKILNEAVSILVDRAVDAFSEGIRRESHFEELVEIANGWADGEDLARRS